jgi:imidazolonepropionase-like amidohydrolase
MTRSLNVPVAFVDVTVMPMDLEHVAPHRTVLVENGRIVAIGPMDAVMTPPETVTIEGNGRFLMPGLADMHVHIQDESMLPMFLVNGITTVRNMWGRPAHLELRDRINQGAVLGPSIITAGPICDGSPPDWPGSAVVTSATDAARTVADQQRAGYDFVKVYNNLSRVAYDGLIDAAAQRRIPVAGHVPQAVGLQRVLEAGQSSIEHLQGYCSPLGRVAPIVEALGLLGVAQATRAAGTWSCVTLVLRERMVSVAQAQQLLARPEMRYVSAATRAFWEARTDDAIRNAAPADWERVRQGNALRKALTQALRDAGAGLLLGTDTPNRLVTPGFALHEELAHLVDAGLTPYEALRTGTHDAATFLGAADEWGTVQAGRRADLLLLDGNPLENVAHVAHPAGVMARGRWLSREQLDLMLEDLAATAGA